jgi:hypothetical protein
MQHRLVHLGTAKLITSDKDFATGFQAGVVYFLTEHKGNILTENFLFNFLTSQINSDQSGPYKAGFISGWYSVFYEGDDRPTFQASILNVAEAHNANPIH